MLVYKIIYIYTSQAKLKHKFKTYVNTIRIILNM